MGNTQTLPALLELPAGGGPPPSKASSPRVQTLLHTHKYPGHQLQCLLAPACHSPHLLPIINPSHRDSPLLFQQERLGRPAGPLHSLFLCLNHSSSRPLNTQTSSLIQLSAQISPRETVPGLLKLKQWPPSCPSLLQQLLPLSQYTALFAITSFTASFLFVHLPQ